jgi:hypothetical protein
VAQNGLMTARQKGRLLNREWRWKRVTHQINPTVNLVESAHAKASFDLVRCHASLNELPAGNDAVLAARKFRNHAIGESNEDLTRYMRVNPSTALDAA